MSKARQQAKTRKNIAYVFFMVAAANILMKLFGVAQSPLVKPTTFSGAVGLEFGKYLAPVLLLAIGWMFYESGKNKALQASYEDGSYQKNKTDR